MKFKCGEVVSNQGNECRDCCVMVDTAPRIQTIVSRANPYIHVAPTQKERERGYMYVYTYMYMHLHGPRDYTCTCRYRLCEN